MLVVLLALSAAFAAGQQAGRKWDNQTDDEVDDLNRSRSALYGRVITAEKTELPEGYSARQSWCARMRPEHLQLRADCLAHEAACLKAMERNPDWLTHQYAFLLARNLSDRAAHLVLLDDLQILPAGTTLVEPENRNDPQAMRYDLPNQIVYAHERANRRGSHAASPTGPSDEEVQLQSAFGAFWQRQK